MEEEVPLKIIELSDFLRSPSILSKRLQFKQRNNEDVSSDQVIKNGQRSNKLQFNETKSSVVLLKQKEISTDNHTDEDYFKQKELVVPKDIIVFADDIDRKKIGLFNKSTNYFSRHLLITSGAALQSLISPLTNAKEWIIVGKLKYSKRYTKQSSIQGYVIISLNVNHPLVRYEILTALELLQQSFNEIKSAYIVIDFSQILKRWFKNYLQRTEQYPSFSNRILYRYQMQTLKCSLTLGKRQSYQDNDLYRSGSIFQKLLRKSDIPMQISIDMNSLPTIVYSIQLNNIFTYSMNDEFKEILKDMGNGLSLVSIQNINPTEEIENKANICPALVSKKEIRPERYSIQKQEILPEKYPIQQQEEINSSDSTLFEPNEQEKILFEQIWNNRMRIQMQHQQLMIKAAHILSFPSVKNDSFTKNK